MKNLLDVKLVAKERKKEMTTTQLILDLHLIYWQKYIGCRKKYRIFNNCDPCLAVFTWKLITTMLSYTKK
jgi:hypothetical protein